MKKIILSLFVLLSMSAGLAQNQMTIEQLFRQVRNNSSSLKVQRSIAEMAHEGVKAAKSQMFPDISTSLSFSYNSDGFVTDRDFTNYMKVPIPDFGNNFTLEAQQAIYTGGLLSSSIRMAEIGAQKAELGMEQYAQAICFVALGHYLDISKMDNQIKVYDKNIKLAKSLIENVRAKYEQGTALKNDITRYELQLEQLKFELQKIRDSRNILNHRLCTLIGLAEETIQPDTTVASGLTTDSKLLADWQSLAVSSSFNIRQSELDIAMAKQEIRMAKSKLLPQVGLVVSNMFVGPIMIEVPVINKNFNYWYAGIGVKYSVSSLFRSNKDLNKARIAEHKAVQQKTVAEEHLENDMHSAYTLYLQSFVDLDTQKKSVQLARQNYDVVNNRYLNQLALVTDMVDAENILLKAELQEANARISVVYAYYKMKYIAGSL